jgi:hypothetical protein
MAETSQEFRAQRLRMCVEQGWKCWWCKRQMLNPETFPHIHPLPPDMATTDHLDDRFSPDRGKFPGQRRRVAACWKCNNDRSRARQAELGKDELRRRSQQRTKSISAP